MKKVILVLGLFAFLFVGSVSIEKVVAGDKDKVVYDDPPKASKKNTKSCADYGSKSKCCSSKCADKGSKETLKDKKEDTKTAETATSTKDTKKDNPDKK